MSQNKPAGQNLYSGKKFYTVFGLKIALKVLTRHADCICEQLTVGFETHHNRENQVKTFKFQIWEHWFGGTNERVIEVKARTEKSATKKLLQICGNRDWEFKLLGVSK